MKPRDVVPIGELRIGDRFLKADTKSKRVWQVSSIALSENTKQVSKVYFIDPYLGVNQKASSKRADYLVQFLRSTI